MDKKTPEWGIFNFMNARTFMPDRAENFLLDSLSPGRTVHTGTGLIPFNRDGAGGHRPHGSKQRPMKNHARNCEVNHQAGDIHERRHKWGGRGGGIQPEPLQEEGQH